MLTAPAWPDPRPTTVTPAQPPHPNTPVIASARWLDFDPWNASLQRMQGNTIDLDFIRAQFPALRDDWALFDNAGGSVVCEQVIARVTEYMRGYGVQLGASYPRSQEAVTLVQQGRAAAAALVGADPEEVIISGSSTMSAYILANAMASSMGSGDNIVVSDLDHEANIGAWRRVAAQRGVEIREWAHSPATLALELDDLRLLVDDRTRFVAFTHCPNVTGSIHDVKPMIEFIHQRGAQVCIDGVAFAPHRMVDVKDLDVDYYMLSLYKVFGPHQGLLYGKRERLLALEGQNHFFIGEDEVPYKLQPGNVNHELTAALPGIVEYLETVASHHGHDAGTTRDRIEAAFGLFATHEAALCRPLLEYLGQRDDARILGRQSFDPEQRVATVAFELASHNAAAVVAHLQEFNIAARFGDFYARRGVARMNLRHADGMVRVSMAHYNTPEEVARVIEALGALK